MDVSQLRKLKGTRRKLRNQEQHSELVPEGYEGGEDIR